MGSGRRFQAAVLIGLLAVGLLYSGCSGKKEKAYRIGILSGLDHFYNVANGFKAKMKELGYVEGKNIVYDIQKTNFEPTKEAKILKKFVADKVDLIFTFPTEATLVAKKATRGSNIPVVFANAHLEGVDVVKSVREPGGNITGVRYPAPDLAIKRFEITHELLPSAKRMLLPYQRGYPSVKAQLAAVRPAAAKLGVKLIEVPLSSPAELQAYLEARPNLDVDAILLVPDPVSAGKAYISLMVAYAEKRKLPICGAPVVLEGYGPVFGLSVDGFHVGQQAAPLADKVLKGVRAGSIPVVSADSFLLINYKAAQMIELKIEEGLLRRADKIIR